MTDREAAIYNKITNKIYTFCEDNYTTKRANFFVIIPQRQLCSSIPASIRRWQKLAGMDTEDSDSEVLESVKGTSIDDTGTSRGPLTTELIHISRQLGDFKDLKQNDSKYKMLIDTLTDYWQNYPEKKVVLFAYYRFTLEYLKERFDEEGINSVLMMGGIDSDEKKKGIARFRDDKKIRVLLTSETLSEGIDLQFCSVLINYDLPWNPMKVEQRIGRIDRIGQEEELIQIHNLFYKETLDDRIYERLYERLDIFREALGDLEAVLGEKISELSYQLISHRLTPEQQEQQIEQTAIALANQKEQQEELESKAGDLTAHGDYILNKVKAAESLKRFIQGKDLWIYTRDFLKENYPGCSLIQ
jgi:superfamily II DNA/RNA helicase